MLRICTCIIVLVLHEGNVTAQRMFSCTSPEFCSDGIGIDPRIESAQCPCETCPPGMVSCLNVKCGIASRNILPGTQDGRATELAFPWHAFLQDNDRQNEKGGYVGGGVLINQYFVLTAAHKISNISSVNVIMGLNSIEDIDGVQLSMVDSIYYHSDYSYSTLRNDIALLHLKTPMNLMNNVNIVCLPQEKKDFQGTPRDKCLVSGYGQVDFIDPTAPTDLKQVHVGVTRTQDCRNSFSDPTLLGANTDVYLDMVTEICAGGQEGLDACTQDGGSPLVCYEPAATLVGLVIWGKKCGLKDVFGVYVNVPQYITWIRCTQNCMTSGVTDCSSCSAVKYL